MPRANVARTTDILPVVSVPVLSEQMVVADPMVSHAERCRTRFCAAVLGKCLTIAHRRRTGLC